MDNQLKRKAIHNIVYALTAQLVSIILSVFMALVVPKLLGVNDFSYWQLFLFYLSYVGFFHLGITDGMYLKIGGKEYDELDKKDLSSQFYFLAFIQIIFLLIIIICCTSFIKDNIRRIILIYVGTYMIIANLNWFLGYIFQATNKVKLYSISVMIDKIIFLLFLIICFVKKYDNLLVFLPIYISTTLVATIFSMIKANDIIKTRPYPLKKSYKICLENSKIGLNLTLSSISSLLILGVGRFMIDKMWGIESFGKFSFSLSLTNFFLLFIAQISIVLFPTLRKVEEKTAKKLFVSFNEILDAFLPMIYIVYIPMKYILGLWLPQYKISLDYLAMLLPLCIFDGKNQMINNTYFKVLREEKKLLRINIITLIISSMLSFISVFIIKNIYCVIVSMLISISFRSVIGENCLYKKIKVKRNFKHTFLELILSFLFIIYNILLDNVYAFVFTILTFIVYSFITKSYEIYYNSIVTIRNRIERIKST